MLQFVIRNENLAKRFYRSPIFDRMVRCDLRSIKHFKDEDLLSYVYRRIGIHGGVTKQTGSGRFLEIDDLASKYISAQVEPRIHDVGVSSGITSVELFDKLHSEGVKSEFLVSDRYAKFFWQRNGYRTEIFDADGRLQCCYLGPIFGDRHSSSKYPLSVWLHKQASALDPTRANEFLLFHPRLLKLIESNAVTVCEYDVLSTKLSSVFSYVRCMNLLNRHYFSEQELLVGIDNLINSLRPEAILQIGRTNQNGENHVGFYRLSNGEIRLVDAIGNGSEVHELVESAGRKALETSRISE